MDAIGANVRRLRLALGMSKETLADQVGYANATMIDQIEKGLKLASTPLAALAQALGVTVSDLVGDKVPCGVTNNANGAHAIGYQRNEGLALMTEEFQILLRQVVTEVVDARCAQLLEEVKVALRDAARKADGATKEEP